MSHNLQCSEVSICCVLKLAKFLAIAIYQQRDIQGGMDMSLVDQAWPVVAVSKTAYSLAVIVSHLG